MEEIKDNITHNVSRKGDLGGKISICRKVLLRNDETPFENRNSSVIETNNFILTKPSKKSYC